MKSGERDLKPIGWWCPKCGMFLHYKGEEMITPEAIYYNCLCKMSYKKREKLKNNWLKRVYILEG